MANTPTGINQGDYIYFFDTSTGNVTGRDWYFPGGTPTGSFAFGPLINYYSVNTNGYQVSLTVTDGVITSSVTENNLIVVSPEQISPSLLISTPVGPFPAGTANLSETITFTATGGTGSGVQYYTWNLPGVAGFTGTSPSVTTNVYDWLTLTGSDLGSLYSTYLASAQVSLSTVVGNTYVASNSLTYNKSGIAESFNLCDVNVTGPTAHNIQYYQIAPYNLATINTSSIGLLGSSYLVMRVYQVDPNYTIDNSSSHVEGETVNYYSPSMDIMPNSEGRIPGLVVASGSAFTVMGESVPPFSRYTVGKYMWPNDISGVLGNQFYFADAQGALTTPLTVGASGDYTKRCWSDTALNLFLNEVPYASISSKSWEDSQSPLPSKVNGITGGLNSYGPCYPSSFGMGGVDVAITLRFYGGPTRSFSGASLLGSLIVNVSTSNVRGNSPDGNLLLAQDTAYYTQKGLAFKLNSAFSSANLTPYMSAVASQYLATYELMPGVDRDEFNGLQISIDDEYVSGSKGPQPILSSGSIPDGYFITKVEFVNTAGGWLSPFGTGYPSYNWLGFRYQNLYNPANSTYDSGPRRGWFFTG